jgi:hypothetical protein
MKDKQEKAITSDLCDGLFLEEQGYGDRASPTGGNSTNAAVVSRTPGFSQQHIRNVRS